MADSTLRELIYGKGAHVDPVACVEDISAELAAQTVAGYPHSIWQIVEHMNFWMDYELGKIAGQARQYPEHAIESWPAAPAADGCARDLWSATTRRFVELLAQLAILADGDPASLEHTIQNSGPPQSPRASTVHAIMWQMAAHNSYHAGQIALLRRQAGAWPPERGGDSW